MPIGKSNDLIGIRTRDLPACSIVPQPTEKYKHPNQKSKNYTKKLENSEETYWLKARTVEPADMAVAREWLCIQTSIARQ
jgi:hypothetical protein